MFVSFNLFLILIKRFSFALETNSEKSLHKIDFGDGNFLSGVEIKINENQLPIRGYYGIRYASVGKTPSFTEHRFKQSVAPFFFEEFTGNVISDKFGPVCPQNLPNMSEYDRDPEMLNSYWRHIKRILPFLKNQDEECLTLNLYVPVTVRVKPIPVLLFVHGESFEIGTGNAYDLSILSSYGQIIGITLNYRLGLLGFLKSDDGKAIGNYAFFDIHAALQWISVHIHRFNGDSDNVTLMGYGHGAALVHLFSLSKIIQDVKKKLFHRLIILNGNGLSSWGWSQFPHMYMDVLGNYMNVSTNHIFEILQKETISNILKATHSTPKLQYSTRIGPSISNQFFTYASKFSKSIVPSDKRFFRDLDVMVGLNSNNAGFFFNIQLNLKNKDFSESVFENRLKDFINENYVYNQQSIFEILKHIYTDWKHIDPEFENQKIKSRIIMFNKIINDAFFITPAIQFCNVHSSIKSYQHKKGKTYLYLFSQSISSTNENHDENAEYFDDLMMLLGKPLKESSSLYQNNNNNQEISKRMINYLTNFIKYGNPNEPKLVLKQNYVYDSYNHLSLDEWPEYTSSVKEYVNFDDKSATRLLIKSDFSSREFKVWNELIPKLHQSFNYPISYHKMVAVKSDTTEKSIQNDFNYNFKFTVPDDPVITTSKMSTSTSPLRTLKLDVSITKSEDKKIEEESVSSTIKEELLMDNFKLNGLLWTILAGMAFFLINSIAIMCIYMNIRKLKSIRQTIRGPINNSLSPLRLEFDNEQPVDLNYSGSDLKTPIDLKHETTFLISNQSPDMYTTSRETPVIRSNSKTINSCSSIKYPYDSTDVKSTYFRVSDNDPVTIV